MFVYELKIFFLLLILEFVRIQTVHAQIIIVGGAAIQNGGIAVQKIGGKE